MPRKCEICEKEFQSDGALVQHYKAKHPDAEPHRNSNKNSFPKGKHSQSQAKHRRNLMIIASVIVIVILLVSLGTIYVGHGKSSLGVTSSSTASSSLSASVRFNFSPACIALNQVGGVLVTGSISPSTSIDVKSATLWWRYHDGGNIWYQLNDLVLGSSFSAYGNFSHTWNPPTVNYYDFEANWTSSSGQVTTATTVNPLQVVAQGTPCPS